METQWPLVIFTLFICLTCGLLGCMSILAFKNQGRTLQMPSLVTAFASLVVGGIGAFLHLQHWERIFNGFGHITSGITQELMGCVALGIVSVIWFVILRKEETLPRWLPIATLIVVVGMLLATAHSYLMPARPAWGMALVAFYIGNACLLGPVALWLIAVIKKDKAVEATAVNLTIIGAVAQLVGDGMYVAACAMATIASYGHYADPTSMTTAPMQVDSLLAVMLTGEGALTFWIALACALVVLACAILAKKKMGASKALMIIAVISAIATSLLFRVLIYQLGYSVFLLY